MDRAEGRLFNVRRIVALDILLHGPTFILLEFGLGAPAALVVGLYALFSAYWLFGTYIISIGVNYLPLLIYAVQLRRNYRDVVSDSDVARIRRKYSIQQFLVFVPLFMVRLALAQLNSSTKR